jgi:hypothetical protein
VKIYTGQSNFIQTTQFIEMKKEHLVVTSLLVWFSNDYPVPILVFS